MSNNGTVLWVLLTVMLCGSPAIGAAAATTLPTKKTEVILDGGHTAQAYGAVGSSGRREVDYNDGLVAQLAAALAQSGFTPILTRQPLQEISLAERVAVTHYHKAAVMLSIHHDSAQLVHLEPVVINGVRTHQTRTPISGYSLFVSGKNRHFAQSLAFARLLGHELAKLGRKPSLHHAEPIPGEGRPLLDAPLGIYQFDDLVVLKKAAIPAVLLEVGVIVDKADEAYVSSRENQRALVKAILAAIEAFTAERRVPRNPAQAVSQE